MKVTMNLSVKFDAIKLPGVFGGSAEGAEFSIGGSGEYTIDEVKELSAMLKESINEMLGTLDTVFAFKDEEPSTESEEPGTKDEGLSAESEVMEIGETYSEYLIRKGLC